MRLERLSLKISLLAFIFIFAQCNDDSFIEEVLVADDAAIEMSSKGKPDGGETAGNNLSFPVIWSDGATKVLRGNMLTATTTGTWWGVWSEDPIDPQAPLYSCGPYIFGETEFCSDTEYKAYIQKDPLNEWQASNWTPDGTTIVDNIDWGDNLESIDWSIRSQIRTEVVLYKNVDPIVTTEYAMRHCYSWGVDEVHGLQTTLEDEIVYGPGTQATVFTDNARLTIQKLSIENIDELYQLNDQGERIGSHLTWRKGDGWTEASGYEGGDLVNDNPLFNMAVHEASDGPGYYNAEVNVKGKVIFGYTWNAKKLNEGEGYYRVTFSFDDDSGRELKTFFESGITNILLPIEEELSAKPIVPNSDDDGDSGEGTRGGDAEIDFDNNLTYMDILLIGKTTGNGGGGGIGGGGGTGGGNTGGGSGGGSGSGGGNH